MTRAEECKWWASCGLHGAYSGKAYVIDRRRDTFVLITEVLKEKHLCFYYA